MNEGQGLGQSGDITTAMVLAAGYGKRMRPLTDTVPKPMVKLAGRALIDHVLERLVAAGITRAVVNVHYKADVLESHLAKVGAPEIIISNERDALLDTGGGIVRALPKLGDAPFVVHNSDSVWIEHDGPNLDRLLAAWDSARMDCLMLLADVETSIGYSGAGDFVMDGDGRLARCLSGQDAPFVFAGVSIAHPRMFDGAKDTPSSLNVMWDRAISKRRLFGVRLRGVWMHVGTPDSILEAEGIIENHRSAAT